MFLCPSNLQLCHIYTVVDVVYHTSAGMVFVSNEDSSIPCPCNIFCFSPSGTNSRTTFLVKPNPVCPHPYPYLSKGELPSGVWHYFGDYFYVQLLRFYYKWNRDSSALAQTGFLPVLVNWIWLMWLEGYSYESISTFRINTNSALQKGPLALGMLKS